MRIYYGVVESRADPLKLGRCKVRVIGIHTEDTKVLPTADLPWAVPIMPCVSASNSGIGYSPTGLIEGTWVAVFFSDGESYQEPIILGSFFGRPEASPKVESEVEQVSPTSASKVTNNAQKSTTTSQNSNVLKQVETYSKTTNKTTGESEYSIGAYTSKMESGGNVGAINEKDGNGASYGKYQMHSGDLRGGKVPDDSTLMTYINQSEYKEEFAGLTPGSKAFNEKWEEIAARDPTGFEESQRDFMVGSQHNFMINRLNTKYNIDLSDRGNGVQEMVFSTSTQYGKRSSVIADALEGKDVSSMTDNEIVETVNAHKIATVDKHFTSQPQSVRDGLKKRWAKESEAQKAMNSNSSAQSENLYNAKKKAAGIETNDEALSEAQKETIQSTPVASSGVTIPSTPTSNNGQGFRDQFGVYPKAGWAGESDTPRLARNENISSTIIEKKKNSLCRGVGTAGGGSWAEPQSAYAPQYPLNHVFQSESGHVREYDDTPNAERIHIYHRKGSFIEFHPNGDVVYKDVNRKFEVTVSDRDIYVGGDCNLTVLGNANIYSKGSMNLKSEDNMNIQTRGNLKMTAGGSMEIVSSGRGNIGSLGILNLSGSRISLNGSWKPSDPDFDIANATAITVAACEKNEINIEDPGSNAEVLANAQPPDSTEYNNDVEAPEEYEQAEEQAGETCPGGEELKSSTKISKYYKLADVTTGCVFRHELREQVGLSKCEIFENLSAAATNVADNVYEHFNGQYTITSGFRQGSGGSQHFRGEAIDFQFPGKSSPSQVLEMAKVADEICSFLPTWDQMILENWTSQGCKPRCNGTVLHISFKKNGSNRKQKKYSPSSTSYKMVNSFYNFVKGDEK